MIDASLSRAPYLSLRHARTGRIGDGGLLPPGWRGEHTAEVEVLDIGSDGGKPSVVVNFKFDGDIASDYVGLCVGQYLPAPKDTVVLLSAKVSLAGWDNVGAAFMIVREWREGGEFVRQSRRPLALGDAPQIGMVALEVGAEGRVAEPMLMVKRQSAAPGSLTVTLGGLAFGSLYDHPRWLCD